MTIYFTSAAKILISKTLRKQALENLAFEFVFDFDFFFNVEFVGSNGKQVPDPNSLVAA